MPVFRVRDYIAVQNDVINDFSAQMQEIGQMSMEVALYIYYKNMEDKALRNDLTFKGVANTFADPFFAELAARAKIAGRKCHRPTLIDESGQLTKLGTITAERLQPIIDALNTIDYDLTLKPQTWNTADKTQLNMTIPLRAAYLLRALRLAVEHAERKQLEDLQQNPELIIQLPDSTKVTRPPGGEYGILNTAPTFNPLAPIEGDTYNSSAIRDPLPEEIAPITIPFRNVQDQPNPNEMDIQQLFEVWCPTISFVQNSRNQLVFLQKFSLVDTRLWRTPGRGRARHVVRPSRIGLLLLEDLAEKGLL